MSFRLEGKFYGEIDNKRFYMPGIKAYDNCEECKTEIMNDYSQHYISYPKVGMPSFMHFYCEHCDHAWVRKVELDLSVLALE